MKIKAIYIGNSEEAFAFENFQTGLNIISSDDNNKGKTIVIQSIVYCLGNIPVFPTAFDYENYFHILNHRMICMMVWQNITDRKV